MNDEVLLDAAQRRRVVELAAARMLGDFWPETAVGLASELVAEGVETPEVLSVALLPSNPTVLCTEEVGDAFDEMCAVLRIKVSMPGEAGWQRARSLASAIVQGSLPPGVGAAQLWRLWEQCGSVPGSDPLDMLQLSEEWETSAGDARDRSKQRIVASARSIIRDADRALGAMQLSAGFVDGALRAVDVMPVLLCACPSFLHRWHNIEADHKDADGEGGRLNYLDAGEFARHILELYGQNNRYFLETAFGLIERMHLEGDDYVRELATIGYLEGVQNAAGHADLDPSVFESYLGPESARWWRGLSAFWSGTRTLVEPID